MSQKETDIYITVQGKDGEAWRPVRAVHQQDDVYRIVAQNDSSKRETWRFSTGDLVRCRPYELTDRDIVLVAYEKV